MTRHLCLILTCLANLSYCINRPVFKIVLTQKGFAQFLQYDIETPPIREFTFCTWVRVFDLSYDQSVFTYVANGNHRVIQMWLDSGGKIMKLSFNGQTSSTFVDMTRNTWRHICISYQSDYGAWAIYLDGRLVSCEAAQKLYGFLLPSGGSVIIGYGVTDNGTPSGLEGEIFGANMILKSTIERNYTIKSDPQYQQRYFHQNKILESENIKYTVLNNLSFDSIPVNSDTTRLPILNTTRSFIKFQSPRGIIEHDVGLDLIPKKPASVKYQISKEKEILDFPLMYKKIVKKDDEKINFWNLLNEAGNTDKLRPYNNKVREISTSGTQELPNISEYETPPPLRSQPSKEFTHTSINKYKKPVLQIFPEVKEKDKVYKPLKINSEYEVSEIVQPPPLQGNTKVYGQWTSSQFANSVLNYLKNINFENKKLKRVPSTIPLLKLSDNLPYASDNKMTKILPPFKIERRNGVTDFIHKRDIKQPEINVKIENGDLRSQILELHAKTSPKNVEVTNRGQSAKNNNYRFYRNVDNQISSAKDANLSKPTPFAVASQINYKKILSDNDLYKNSKLMSILPFLKSAEYFFDEFGGKTYLNRNEMYTKSLLKTNKWHNIQSYNNEYTPRGIKMESGEINFSNDQNAETNNKKQPIKVKYKPENHRLVKIIDEAEIKNARALASEISSFLNNDSNSISILKYNHGHLSNKKIKNNNAHNFAVNNSNKNGFYKNDFNQHIKIGNALNERFVIGNNEENKKSSFVGGLENIPDIHRYRSDIDNEREMVPPSLGPRVCKNIESHDHLLYVQPDGSVDVIRLLSPIKEKNLGMEFVEQNYKKCSLEESLFKKNPLLLIDWIKTPVRLFGGSHPKKTNDLCGFF